MATSCVWLADVDDTMSEKFLADEFSRYGVVTATYIDRRLSRALVFFDGVEHARRAVSEIKSRPVRDRRLQVSADTLCCRCITLTRVIDYERCAWS